MKLVVGLGNPGIEYQFRPHTLGFLTIDRIHLDYRLSDLWHGRLKTIRIAGATAKFGISEARWGLFPLGGSTVRLRRQIPYTQAMEILRQVAVPKAG